MDIFRRIVGDGKMKEVMAYGGQVFLVDTSDEACLPFGFRSGDRIKDGSLSCSTKLVVVGVAPYLPQDPNSKKVLWVADVDGSGRVGYYDGYLVRRGFHKY